MRLSEVRDLDPNLLWTVLTYSGFQLPRHQLHCVMVVIWVHRARTSSSLSLLIFRDFIQWFQQVACGRGICSHVITILSTDNNRDSLVTASLSKSTRSPSASRFSGAIALWSWFRSSSKLATVSAHHPPSLLNESLWPSIAPSWASSEIQDFQKQFQIVCSVTSPNKLFWVEHCYL